MIIFRWVHTSREESLGNKGSQPLEKSIFSYIQSSSCLVKKESANFEFWLTLFSINFPLQLMDSNSCWIDRNRCLTLIQISAWWILQSTQRNHRISPNVPLCTISTWRTCIIISPEDISTDPHVDIYVNVMGLLRNKEMRWMIEY